MIRCWFEVSSYMLVGRIFIIITIQKVNEKINGFCVQRRKGLYLEEFLNEQTSK